MKSYFKSVFALTIICAVVGLALAGTNMLTAPVIEKSEQEAVNQSLQVVMPGGSDFSPVDTSALDLPQTVKAVYKEAGGGYVIRLETSGYSSGMVIMCGVDSAGSVTGATCLASGETLGYEKTYGDSFTDKTLENIDSVDTVASATKTTTAYKNALKDALGAVQILKGGD